jgi:hypothetical protein
MMYVRLMKAKARAENMAEQKAWEEDHPGQEYTPPERLGDLRKFTDYERWERLPPHRSKARNLP